MKNRGRFARKMPTRLLPDIQAKVREWDQRYGIGYIPCITSAKDVHIKNWQNIDFSTIDFEANLKAGLYDQGIALVLGKTLTPPDAPYNYSFALDFDGWDAIEAWFGNWENVLSASQKTRIEWHDDKEKIHYIFLSKRPIQNRKIKIKRSQLEIRCENQLLFCSPFTHKDGIPYTPLGTHRIVILDENQLLSLEAQIDTLCHGYMSDHDKQRYIAWLEDPNTILGEGQGRHPALVTLGMSYYFRSNNGWFKLTDEERKIKLSEWHVQHCKPPKPEKEFDKIWGWIVDHCKGKRDEEFKNKKISVTAATAIKSEDYADELIKEYNLITLWDTDDIWRYAISVGIFVPHAEPIIKARIEEDLGHPYIDKNGEERPGITTRGVNECLDHIRRRTYTSRDALNPYLEWIACNNCMINLKRPGETWPFNPEFMCTTRIPVKYIKYNLPHSDCGNISDFFRLVECACHFWINFYCCTGNANCAKKAEFEHEKRACSTVNNNRKTAEPWNLGTYFLLCDSSKKEVRGGFIY